MFGIQNLLEYSSESFFMAIRKKYAAQGAAAKSRESTCGEEKAGDGRGEARATELGVEAIDEADVVMAVKGVQDAAQRMNDKHRAGEGR